MRFPPEPTARPGERPRPVPFAGTPTPYPECAGAPGTKASDR